MVEKPMPAMATRPLFAQVETGFAQASSASQLAWGHALVAEAARAAKVACVQVDVDLNKAVDSVDLCRLISELLSFGVLAPVGAMTISLSAAACTAAPAYALTHSKLTASPAGTPREATRATWLRNCA